MPITLTFHESQYLARVAEQLRHGLRTRRLSMKPLGLPGPSAALAGLSPGLFALSHGGGAAGALRTVLCGGAARRWSYLAKSSVLHLYRARDHQSSAPKISGSSPSLRPTSKSAHEPGGNIIIHRSHFVIHNPDMKSKVLICNAIP